MKRKFILLPITLTALAPVISLVGCGDPDKPEPPEPEYHEYEIKPGGKYHITDEFTLLKNNYYKFWVNNWDATTNVGFWFGYDWETELIVDVDVVKVLVNGEETDFEEYTTPQYGWWVEFFVDGSEIQSNFEIYLKCNKTENDVYGFCA